MVFELGPSWVHSICFLNPVNIFHLILLIYNGMIKWLSIIMSWNCFGIDIILKLSVWIKVASRYLLPNCSNLKLLQLMAINSIYNILIEVHFFRAEILFWTIFYCWYIVASIVASIATNFMPLDIVVLLRCLNIFLRVGSYFTRVFVILLAILKILFGVLFIIY